MKVLIACEFSGVVRNAFLDRGHDAWLDLLPSEDGDIFKMTFVMLCIWMIGIS